MKKITVNYVKHDRKHKEELYCYYDSIVDILLDEFIGLQNNGAISKLDYKIDSVYDGTDSGNLTMQGANAIAGIKYIDSVLEDIGNEQ